MNSAFVEYEELSNSDLALLDLLNSSYLRKPNLLIAKYYPDIRAKSRLFFSNWDSNTKNAITS